MFARERKESILIYMRQHKKASIKELIEEFEKMDHKMEQCFISYESIDGV